jgi:hypothetical protein
LLRVVGTLVLAASLAAPSALLLGGLASVAVGILIASGVLTPILSRRHDFVAPPARRTALLSAATVVAGIAMLLYAGTVRRIHVRLTSCVPVRGEWILPDAGSEPLVAQIEFPWDGWYCVRASPSLRFHLPISALYRQAWEQAALGKSSEADCAAVATWLSDRVLVESCPRAYSKKRFQNIIADMGCPQNGLEFCQALYADSPRVYLHHHANTAMDYTAYVPPPVGRGSQPYSLQVTYMPEATPEKGAGVRLRIVGQGRFAAIGGDRDAA